MYVWGASRGFNSPDRKTAGSAGGVRMAVAVGTGVSVGSGEGVLLGKEVTVASGVGWIEEHAANADA